MLIFDLNQVAIANLMEQIGPTNEPVDISLVRHMMLNTIRANIKKFRGYGEVILACDNKKYWRTEVFQHYKATRKKNRKDSGYDWNSIFYCMNTVRDEFKEFAPYKVIDVHNAEADDVIAILTKMASSKEKVMILSRDKDFVQLQTNPNVSQYSPITKQYISADNPKAHLKELIISGDKSDGIPNILSVDNSFVDGIRQKALTQVKLNEMMFMDLDNDGPEELRRNWSRNKQLIDFDYIPKSVSDDIISTYENTKPATKTKFTNYLIANRLSNLISVLDEF